MMLPLIIAVAVLVAFVLGITTGAHLATGGIHKTARSLDQAAHAALMQTAELTAARQALTAPAVTVHRLPLPAAAYEPDFSQTGPAQLGAAPSGTGLEGGNR